MKFLFYKIKFNIITILVIIATATIFTSFWLIPEITFIYNNKSSETNFIEKYPDKDRNDLVIDEIAVYTFKNNEKGIIKFKLGILVNDTKVRDFLNTKNLIIKEALTNSIGHFLVKDLIKSYQDRSLHKIIVNELNKIVGNNIKVEKTLLSGKNMIFKVVEVKIYDFLAKALE